MIIAYLAGGLGNQLFQYGVGLAIAARNHESFKLDISGFQKDSLRNYRLDHFNVSAEIADDREVALLTGGNLPKPLRAAYWRVQNYLPLRDRTIVRERGFAFDPAMVKVGKKAYLIGYWQSFKYFEKVEPRVRREFQVLPPPMGQNAKLASEITTRNSISVHVRRADLVSVPLFNRVHGTCSIEYYALATAFVKQRIEEPHLFVFSDDMEWARQNLRFDAPVTYIDHNGADCDYEDLRLMTLCKHHVIANSTFSWWGAWLAENANKIVVAPRKWFKDPNINTNDLIPKSWIRL